MLSIHHAVDAVSSLRALHALLTEELAQIEVRLQELPEANLPAPEQEAQHAACVLARTAICSGLASITDVLGWVHLMTEKDADGNEIAAVRALPSVPVSSIN